MLALLLIMNALFAATYPLTQAALYHGSIALIIAIRMLCAGLALLVYSKARRVPLFNEKLVSQSFLFGGITLGGLYIPFILEGWALTQISGLEANIIYLLNPMVSAFLSYFIEGERLHLQQVTALILGISGAFILTILQNSDQHVITLSSLMPMVALIGSMCLSTYSWFIFKRLLNDHPYYLIHGWTMLGAGLLSFSSLFISYSSQLIPPTVQSWSFLGLYSLLLALIGNIAAYTMYAKLLKHFSITFITLAQLTCPMFGALYEFVQFGSVPTIATLIAFSIITCGMVLFLVAPQDVSNSDPEAQIHSS